LANSNDASPQPFCRSGNDALHAGHGSPATGEGFVDGTLDTSTDLNATKAGLGKAMRRRDAAR
jgi:hypothetical protein